MELPNADRLPAVAGMSASAKGSLLPTMLRNILLLKTTIEPWLALLH
jgi:hypothetical protein